jgi:two-component system KDP operon response regulator KdpE
VREQPLILAVDDEPRLLHFLRTNLQLAGYRVVTAEDGARALHQVEAHMPDLMLLDLAMPGMDGFSVLGQVRRFSELPVIILTALDSEDDKVRGLEMGADDYLTKPFGSRELQARIAAVLRRARPVAKLRLGTYKNGELFIDFASRRVQVEGTCVHLTPMEYRLLTEFAQHPNHVLTHGRLLSHVWGPEYREDVYVLRATIWRLRQKIEPDPSQPRFIVSEPGVGYRLFQP